MGKPILFDTISRAKFDKLSDDVKKRKNYQIKENDGMVSKHIAGLENGGGSKKIYEFSSTQLGTAVIASEPEKVQEIVGALNEKFWEVGFLWHINDPAEVIFLNPTSFNEMDGGTRVWTGQLYNKIYFIAVSEGEGLIVGLTNS